MTIQTVGIIGAGTMGNGIAQACAVSGINVVMVDISDAAVQKGLATVAGSLDRLIKKEKISEADKAAALALVKGSTSYDDLKGCQLVIEAATENPEIKNKILKQLDELLPPAWLGALSLHEDAAIDWALATLCRAIYDPRRDDADFRRSLVGDAAQRKAAFDQLRKHYPHRREIDGLQVRLDGDAPHLAALVGALGCRVL